MRAPTGSSTASRTRSASWPDDHHDLLDARRRGRVDRVLDERLPAEPFDLLRGAEPPALARGEDHRGDHPSRFPNSRAKKRLMPAHIADRPSRNPPIALVGAGAGVSAAMSAEAVSSTSCAEML